MCGKRWTRSVYRICMKGCVERDEHIVWKEKNKCAKIVNTIVLDDYTNCVQGCVHAPMLHTWKEMVLHRDVFQPYSKQCIHPSIVSHLRRKHAQCPVDEEGTHCVVSSHVHEDSSSSPRPVHLHRHQVRKINTFRRIHNENFRRKHRLYAHWWDVVAVCLVSRWRERSQGSHAVVAVLNSPSC